MTAETAAFQTPRTLAPLPPEDDTLISAAHLPDFIGVARQTLARWRHEGSGPPFVRVGSRIFYRAEDVRDWLKGQRQTNTI